MGYGCQVVQHAGGCLSIARTVFALAACSLFACGPDAEDVACRESLDDWCERVECGPTRNIADVLPPLPGPSAEGVSNDLLRTNLGFAPCDELLVLGRYGTSFYDETSGALVGASSPNGAPDAGCPGDVAVGRQPSGRCDVCGLAGNNRRRACEGPISKPWRAQCNEHPPESIATCTECACLHCYPLANCANAGLTDLSQVLPIGLCQSALRDCVREYECQCEDDDP